MGYLCKSKKFLNLKIVEYSFSFNEVTLYTSQWECIVVGEWQNVLKFKNLLKFEILLISQAKPRIKFRKYLLKSSQSLFYKKIKICTHIKPLTTPPIFKLINQSAHRYTRMGRIRGHCMRNADWWLDLNIWHSGAVDRREMSRSPCVRKSLILQSNETA